MTAAIAIKPATEPTERCARARSPLLLCLPKGREERALACCEAVIDLAAALFNVCGKELRRPGRTGLEVARVRQIAMYAAHVNLEISMREVGKGFGRDRTTVIHACQTIEDMRDDQEFDRHVATFERVVRAAFLGDGGKGGGE